MLSESPDSTQDPVPSAINDTPVTSKSGLSSSNIVVIFLVGVLAFGGGLFFSRNLSQIIPFLSSKSVDIPLEITSPSVYRASFVYAFQTKVVGLEEKDGKTILKTDLTGINNLPEFVIDNDTVVAVVQNDTETRVKNNNVLTPGTPIYAYLSYNLIQKKWLTTRIAIVKPDVKITPVSFTRPVPASGSTKTTK